MKKMKFRVWYLTQYGVGIDVKLASSEEALKLSEKQRKYLIEIEHL